MDAQAAIWAAATSLKLSRTNLAKVLGITQGAASHKIGGRNRWTLDDVDALNKVLPPERQIILTTLDRVALAGAPEVTDSGILPDSSPVVVSARAPRSPSVYRREHPDRLWPRRQRVLELLDSGRTCVEIGAMLVAEGFTCNRQTPAKTVWSDRDWLRARGLVVDEQESDESITVLLADFESDNVPETTRELVSA